MDLDLQNIFEIIQIKKLISHDEKLLEFFDELIKVKNLELQDLIINESSDDESSDYESDNSYDYFSSD